MLMALDNLISVTFTKDEINDLNTAIQSIRSILADKAVNLTPEERKQYGSIADRNKVLVDKAKRYMDQFSELVPRVVDKAEFDRDYQTREQIAAPLRELARITEMLVDIKTLLDHDNYNGAIAFYRYIKYLASENEPGTTSVYQDMKQHYQSRRSQTDPPQTENTDETNAGTEDPEG